ncbi:putative multicopper oxidase, partial [Colletotrichum sublineola]
HVETAVNSYFGQAGAYIVEDVAEEKLGLPSGYGVYDIPLILTSKRYGSDGALTSPAGEIENLFGDVVHVNGQPWPFFQVEPRKYRLRFLNAAVSRSFILYFQQEFGPGVPYQEAGPGVPSPGGGPGVPFPGGGPGAPYPGGGPGAPFPGGGPGVPSPGGGPGVPNPGSGPGVPFHDGGAGIPFQVVASDSGLLAGPVPANMLAIANAERWEVVFDFSPFAGQNLTLMNQLEVGQDKDYAPTTDQVMRFVVGPGAVADTSVVPVRLRDVPFPPPKGDVVDRRFLFHQQNGLWKINGVGFSDVQNRVLAKVPRGTVEVWEFENGGGGVHPIHVHLVDFRILSRVGAGRSVLPHEAAGLKDVVWLGPGEVVRVEAHYAPWDGVYMFHCHNMIHEDHEMMAAFNVSSLADLGYKEASFADPMDPKWRAVPVSPVAFSNDAVVQKVQAMAALQPYNIGGEVWRKIAQRWSA